MTILKHGDFSALEDYVSGLETDTLLLVVDGNVWQEYRQEIDFEKKLKGKKVILWKTPDGEDTKNFAEFESCVEFFLEKGVHRKAHLLAVGGGALSDFAGFIAATLLRGISWSVVPTTLLSMVDASVGGKVAINSKSGKNLIGAFHKPDLVFFNMEFLKSLPESEIISGKGEILKYCLLDKNLHDTAVGGAEMKEIVMACSEYKNRLTEEDFKEGGKRKILNYGHTLGHGLEYLYRIPHGEAVMWGILLIDEVFQDKKLRKEIKSILASLDWNPGQSPWLNKTFPAGKLMEYLAKDKKMISTGKIDLVLAEKPGHPVIATTPVAEIEKKLMDKSDELRKLTF